MEHNIPKVILTGYIEAGKWEEGGLISSEGCITMKENNLGWYVRNSVEPSIESVMKAAETTECNDTVNKK